jgi:2-deoxy-D-gluconate 3-dehydrogenase
MNYFDIKGKKAIVTGAAQGLGLGMAEGLLESGCEVALVDIAPKLAQTAAGFIAKGYQAHAIQGDLAKRDEIRNLFQEILHKMGRVDILVNAAGVQRRHPSEEFPMEDWDLVLNINLSAVFMLSQLAAREMIKQGNGKIINIASMVSWFGGVTIPAYTASKGAVAQLTKALANDWAVKGINVNAIAPGYMNTDMNEKIINNATRYEEISDRIPMRRWGTPDDMKGTVIFLASKASDYLSGAIIPVDGGYLCR